VAHGREPTAELLVLEEAAGSVAAAGGEAISPRPGTAEGPNACEALVPPEREAILEVQCFAGPRVLHKDEELWPSAAAGREQKAFQLLLFLAAHSTDGVDRDKAAEALLADDESADPVATLRQWRKRVRALLGRLVPDLPEDLFEDSGRSYRLNPRMVRSDVQRFLELERWAKSKARHNPEPAYEAMRALYVGDLFDRAAAQPYAWAVAPGAGGVSLVQEYRQVYQEATRTLAERYAATADDPRRAERALELYEELVRLDPINERLWSALFRLHARLGDRVALERDWRRLCQLLQDEAPDAQPRGTTRELYQQLLRSVDAQPAAPLRTA
jgi:DNA-binding SARP family transcriptional activator